MSLLFEESILWTAGELGCETFYIYGICRSAHFIHVFAEGRIERHDRSPHHIVHRRSRDNGRTWEETRFVVRSDNGECFCNPTAVWDAEADRLILLYAENFDNDVSGLFVKTSEDDGVNWSEPSELTSLFDEDAHGRSLHLPGPGHGLQTSSGGLIFPVWHRKPLSLSPEERVYGISLIYSDDSGETFHNLGEIEPGPEMLNESRVVEMSDGRLIVNARSGAFTVSPRYISASDDGGMTWSRPKEMDLPTIAFATDSSFLRISNNTSELLFIRPDGEMERRDLTAYLSDDEGASWRKARRIYTGVAGYSDAALLNDGTVGVVFGCDTLVTGGDVEGNVTRTVFYRFNTDWLTEEQNDRAKDPG